MGWVTITHPFHPFRGQRFRVLKLRKVGGQDTLILQGTYRGTFAVSREWTDRADPLVSAQAGLPAPLLCFRSLLMLVELIDGIKERDDEGRVDK